MKKRRYPFINLKKANSIYGDCFSKAFGRVLESGRYVGGPEVKSFEDAFSEYTGVTYTVGVGSGLDALRLILRALVLMGKLAEGDEVIVAANAYIASVLAISDAGLIPVPVEPDIMTMNLSVRGIESNLSEKTKAIMPVHLYGRMCMDKEMLKIARNNGLLIIEDCAQAIGASYVAPDSERYKAGSLGIAGAFSFYPTKNIGCLGDGGAVTTNDRELADIVRALGNYGSDYRYHNVYKGYNSRLDTLQAAFLHALLPFTDKVNQLRRRKATIYSEKINRDNIILPMMPNDEKECVWHQYVIRITDGRRDEFREKLEREGVETDIHYPIPVHLQPCYPEYHDKHLPIAEQLSKEILSLPIGNHLTEKDIEEISEIINCLR